MVTIVVYVEHAGGSVRRASLESIGAARAAGGDVVAVLCGAGADAAAQAPRRAPSDWIMTPGPVPPVRVSNGFCLSPVIHPARAGRVAVHIAESPFAGRSGRVPARFWKAFSKCRPINTRSPNSRVNRA